VPSPLPVAHLCSLPAPFNTKCITQLVILFHTNNTQSLPNQG
jgi:hypothetical protein